MQDPDLNPDSTYQFYTELRAVNMQIGSLAIFANNPFLGVEGVRCVRTMLDRDLEKKAEALRAVVWGILKKEHEIQRSAVAEEDKRKKEERVETAAPDDGGEGARGGGGEGGEDRDRDSDDDEREDEDYDRHDRVEKQRFWMIEPAHLQFDLTLAADDVMAKDEMRRHSQPAGRFRDYVDIMSRLVPATQSYLGTLLALVLAWLREAGREIATEMARVNRWVGHGGKQKALQNQVYRQICFGVYQLSFALDFAGRYSADVRELLGKLDKASRKLASVESVCDEFDLGTISLKCGESVDGRVGGRDVYSVYSFDRADALFKLSYARHMLADMRVKSGDTLAFYRRMQRNARDYIRAHPVPPRHNVRVRVNVNPFLEPLFAAMDVRHLLVTLTHIVNTDIGFGGSPLTKAVADVHAELEARFAQIQVKHWNDSEMFRVNAAGRARSVSTGATKAAHREMKRLRYMYSLPRLLSARPHGVSNHETQHLPLVPPEGTREESVIRMRNEWRERRTARGVIEACCVLREEAALMRLVAGLAAIRAERAAAALPFADAGEEADARRAATIDAAQTLALHADIVDNAIAKEMSDWDGYAPPFDRAYATRVLPVAIGDADEELDRECTVFAREYSVAAYKQLWSRLRQCEAYALTYDAATHPDFHDWLDRVRVRCENHQAKLVRDNYHVQKYLDFFLDDYADGLGSVKTIRDEDLAYAAKDYWKGRAKDGLLCVLGIWKYNEMEPVVGGGLLPGVGARGSTRETLLWQAMANVNDALAKMLAKDPRLKRLAAAAGVDVAPKGSPRKRSAKWDPTRGAGPPELHGALRDYVSYQRWRTFRATMLESRYMEIVYRKEHPRGGAHMVHVHPPGTLIPAGWVVASHGNGVAVPFNAYLSYARMDDADAARTYQERHPSPPPKTLTYCDNAVNVYGDHDDELYYADALWVASERCLEDGAVLRSVIDAVPVAPHNCLFRHTLRINSFALPFVLYPSRSANNPYDIHLLMVVANALYAKINRYQEDATAKYDLNVVLQHSQLTQSLFTEGALRLAQKEYKPLDPTGTNADAFYSEPRGDGGQPFPRVQLPPLMSREDEVVNDVPAFPASYSAGTMTPEDEEVEANIAFSQWRIQCMFMIEALRTCSVRTEDDRRAVESLMETVPRWTYAANDYARTLHATVVRIDRRTYRTVNIPHSDAVDTVYMRLAAHRRFLATAVKEKKTDDVLRAESVIVDLLLMRFRQQFLVNVTTDDVGRLLTQFRLVALLEKEGSDRMRRYKTIKAGGGGKQRESRDREELQGGGMGSDGDGAAAAAGGGEGDGSKRKGGWEPPPTLEHDESFLDLFADEESPGVKRSTLLEREANATYDFENDLKTFLETPMLSDEVVKQLRQMAELELETTSSPEKAKQLREDRKRRDSLLRKEQEAAKQLPEHVLQLQTIFHGCLLHKIFSYFGLEFYEPPPPSPSGETKRFRRHRPFPGRNTETWHRAMHTALYPNTAQPQPDPHGGTGGVDTAKQQRRQRGDGGVGGGGGGEQEEEEYEEYATRESKLAQPPELTPHALFVARKIHECNRLLRKLVVPGSYMYWFVQDMDASLTPMEMSTYSGILPECAREETSQMVGRNMRVVVEALCQAATGRAVFTSTDNFRLYVMGTVMHAVEWLAARVFPANVPYSVEYFGRFYCSATTLHDMLQLPDSVTEMELDGLRTQLLLSIYRSKEIKEKGMSTKDLDAYVHRYILEQKRHAINAAANRRLGASIGECLRDATGKPINLQLHYVNVDPEPGFMSRRAGYDDDEETSEEDAFYDYDFLHHYEDDDDEEEDEENEEDEDEDDPVWTAKEREALMYSTLPDLKDFFDVEVWKRAIAQVRRKKKMRRERHRRARGAMRRHTATDRSEEEKDGDDDAPPFAIFSAQENAFTSNLTAEELDLIEATRVDCPVLSAIIGPANLNAIAIASRPDVGRPDLATKPAIFDGSHPLMVGAGSEDEANTLLDIIAEEASVRAHYDRDERGLAFFHAAFSHLDNFIRDELARRLAVEKKAAVEVAGSGGALAGEIFVDDDDGWDEYTGTISAPPVDTCTTQCMCKSVSRSVLDVLVEPAPPGYRYAKTRGMRYADDFHVLMHEADYGDESVDAYGGTGHAVALFGPSPLYPELDQRTRRDGRVYKSEAPDDSEENAHYLAAFARVLHHYDTIEVQRYEKRKIAVVAKLRSFTQKCTGVLRRLVLLPPFAEREAPSGALPPLTLDAFAECEGPVAFEKSPEDGTDAATTTTVSTPSTVPPVSPPSPVREPQRSPDPGVTFSPPGSPEEGVPSPRQSSPESPDESARGSPAPSTEEEGTRPPAHLEVISAESEKEEVWQKEEAEGGDEDREERTKEDESFARTRTQSTHAAVIESAVSEDYAEPAHTFDTRSLQKELEAARRSSPPRAPHTVSSQQTGDLKRKREDPRVTTPDYTGGPSRSDDKRLRKDEVTERKERTESSVARGQGETQPGSITLSPRAPPTPVGVSYAFPPSPVGNLKEKAMGPVATGIGEEVDDVHCIGPSQYIRKKLRDLMQVRPVSVDVLKRIDELREALREVDAEEAERMEREEREAARRTRECMPLNGLIVEEVDRREAIETLGMNDVERDPRTLSKFETAKIELEEQRAAECRQRETALMQSVQRFWESVPALVHCLACNDNADPKNVVHVMRVLTELYDQTSPRGILNKLNRHCNMLADCLLKYRKVPNAFMFRCNQELIARGLNLDPSVAATRLRAYSANGNVIMDYRVSPFGDFSRLGGTSVVVHGLHTSRSMRYFSTGRFYPVPVYERGGCTEELVSKHAKRLIRRTFAPPTNLDTDIAGV